MSFSMTRSSMRRAINYRVHGEKDGCLHPLPSSITVTKILFKINLGTGIGEVVGTDPDRVSEEGVREHDGGG